MKLLNYFLRKRTGTTAAIALCIMLITVGLPTNVGSEGWHFENLWYQWNSEEWGIFILVLLLILCVIVALIAHVVGEFNRVQKSLKQ